MDVRKKKRAKNGKGYPPEFVAKILTEYFDFHKTPKQINDENPGPSLTSVCRWIRDEQKRRDQLLTQEETTKKSKWEKEREDLREIHRSEIQELRDTYEKNLQDLQDAHEKKLEELHIQIKDLTLYAEIGRFYIERKNGGHPLAS